MSCQHNFKLRAIGSVYTCTKCDMDVSVEMYQQLTASQQEVETLKKCAVDNGIAFLADIEEAKKQAAREILQLLYTADWDCSTYEETYYGSVAAIKSKFGLEG